MLSPDHVVQGTARRSGSRQAGLINRGSYSMIEAELSLEMCTTHVKVLERIAVLVNMAFWVLGLWSVPLQLPVEIVYVLQRMSFFSLKLSAL